MFVQGCDFYTLQMEMSLDVEVMLYLNKIGVYRELLLLWKEVKEEVYSFGNQKYFLYKQP